MGHHVDSISDNIGEILGIMPEKNLLGIVAEEYRNYLFGTERMKKEEIHNDSAYTELMNIIGENILSFRIWERNPKKDPFSPSYNGCCFEVGRNFIFNKYYMTPVHMISDPFASLFDIELDGKMIGNIYQIVGENGGISLYLDSMELDRKNPFVLKNLSDISDASLYCFRSYADLCGFENSEVGACFNSKGITSRFGKKIRRGKKLGKKYYTDTFIFDRYTRLPFALTRKVPESYFEDLEAKFEA